MTEPISLTEEETSRIEYVLSRWGRLTERRGEPIMAMLDGTEVSPIDISQAMSEPYSRLYQHMFALVQAGLAGDVNLDTILADFEVPEDFK